MWIQPNTEINWSIPVQSDLQTLQPREKLQGEGQNSSSFLSCLPKFAESSANDWWLFYKPLHLATVCDTEEITRRILLKHRRGDSTNHYLELLSMRCQYMDRTTSERRTLRLLQTAIVAFRCPASDFI